MAEESNIVKGFEILNSVIGQTVLITGTLISVTLIVYEHLGERVKPNTFKYLKRSWWLLGTSILFGFYGAYFLGYRLINDSKDLLAIYVWPNVHFILFIIGLIYTILFVLKNLRDTKSNKSIDWKDGSEKQPMNNQEVLIYKDQQCYICRYDSKSDKYVLRDDPKTIFDVSKILWREISNP